MCVNMCLCLCVCVPVCMRASVFVHEKSSISAKVLPKLSIAVVLQVSVVQQTVVNPRD